MIFREAAPHSPVKIIEYRGRGGGCTYIVEVGEDPAARSPVSGEDREMHER